MKNGQGIKANFIEAKTKLTFLSCDCAMVKADRETRRVRATPTVKKCDSISRKYVLVVPRGGWKRGGYSRKSTFQGELIKSLQ